MKTLREVVIDKISKKAEKMSTAALFNTLRVVSEMEYRDSLEKTREKNIDNSHSCE